MDLNFQKDETLVKLGLKIKLLRKSKGLTQTKLAHIMGKTHPAINRLEKGKINPSIVFLYEIAEGLDIPIHELFS